MNSYIDYAPLAPPLLEENRQPGCRVSIIIPARNEEAGLRRTLDALFEQRDLPNDPLDRNLYEVILLLNNCTDGSPELARQYQFDHPDFHLHLAVRELPPDLAHVGTARRLLMDTAFHRLNGVSSSAILSTDADTAVAPDWIARNLAAIEAGAEAVGGVIHLFPEDLTKLIHEDPETALAYQRDRDLQRLIAQLESILDPDPADPWPRHLEHFGASLACTPESYARAGGLPAVRALEDVAFVDALRKVGARLRHCPNTHIFTSARLDGRAEVGLSGQLRRWHDGAQAHSPHLVDSAEWLAHRFRSLAALRRLNDSERPGSLSAYPAPWRDRMSELLAEGLPTPRFLERLDCDSLIEETFIPLKRARQAEITEVVAALPDLIAAVQVSALALR